MTPANGRKKKVAILGGGPAGLAAAFELTATKELRDEYDVTVHQLGWRLGGKGASGRNAKYGNRIQEHGLHIWFGFYDNAFNLMRRCYEELDRPEGVPLATLEEAFEPEFRGVQYECYKDAWVAHDIALPALPGNPGEFGRPRPWDVVKWATRLLMERMGDLWTLDSGPQMAAAPIATRVELPPDVTEKQVIDERN